eukprot:TRINITY_DN8382_c0_g1_i1.p1 TRINITY_DN8382_c0_g1~~TRINITY_DN8382_c0_g1_i1.p1  ORF type:complete len:177 (-),score=44.31 TRINITY_DN8382_c0_g1_i1:601-1080(-)
MESALYDLLEQIVEDHPLEYCEMVISRKQKMDDESDQQKKDLMNLAKQREKQIRELQEEVARLTALQEEIPSLNTLMKEWTEKFEAKTSNQHATSIPSASCTRCSKMGKKKINPRLPSETRDVLRMKTKCEEIIENESLIIAQEVNKQIEHLRYVNCKN